MRPSRSSRTSQGGTKGGTTPGKVNSQKKTAKGKNKDMVDIQPVVYSFRVPSNPSPGSIMNAPLPPYWLHHDHAFGVIWTLFHPDKKFIGIGQLHWCLRFLLDLKNTVGEYTEDVNVCIQAIQDDLIERYANLGTTLENQETPKNEDGNNTEKNEGSDAKTGKGVVSDSEQNESPEAGKELDDKKNRRSSEQLSICSTINDSGNFSLTYNQMISRGPAPYTKQTPLEQIYKAGTGATTADIVASSPEIEALLTLDTSPEISLTKMGTSELVNFLNSYRTEHVERIKKDIERIYDLEKFIQELDKSGFKSCVPEDMARRLDHLDGQTVDREAGNRCKGLERPRQDELHMEMTSL